MSSFQILLSLNIFFIAVAAKPSGSGRRFLIFLRFSPISPVGFGVPGSVPDVTAKK